MPTSMRAGDTLAGRYRLIDLMTESANGRFWRAWDHDLARSVAVHIIPATDERAQPLFAAAQRSATLHDRHLLRVLDADRVNDLIYVVNEWGEGLSLDRVLLNGPIEPHRAAWIVSEVGELLINAHAQNLTHGRLTPEQVLIDEGGAIKVIGFAVDGALHGLGEGRVEDDVHDLAALLYAALTAKWPGRAGTSQVPPAPRSHGKVLRPRQVRAGVPRRLDVIWGEVDSPSDTSTGLFLSASAAQEYNSAQGIVDACLEFIGDPQILAEAERERSIGNTNPRIPRITAPILAPDETQVAARPVRETAQRPGARPAAPAEPVPAEPAQQPSDTSERDEAVGEEVDGKLDGKLDGELGEETQAGVPVFYDQIPDVGWATPERVEAPPPPPLEDPPERPLFAPDPPGGRPLRPTPDDHGAGHQQGTGWGGLKDQPPGHGPPGQESSANADDSMGASGTFWPWATGVRSAVGADGEVVEDEPVPGRSWLRIAAFIALALVMTIAAIYAFNRGRDSDDSNAGDGSTGSNPAGSSLTIDGVRDFDPLADPPRENPDQTRLAIDDDPQTGWQTTRYSNQFGPDGIKTGVGLLLDLGTAQDVRSVQLRLNRSPTRVQLLAATGGLAPQRLDQVSELASGEASGQRLTLTPKTATTARWLVVWITSLPQVGDKFQAQINSIVVNK